MNEMENGCDFLLILLWLDSDCIVSFRMARKCPFKSSEVDFAWDTERKIKNKSGIRRCGAGQRSLRAFFRAIDQKHNY